MPPTLSALDTTGLLVLSGGAALLGLALLLGGRSPSRRRRLALGLAALLATCLASAAPPLGALAGARLPLLALAGACAACLLLSYPFPRRLLALAGRPHAQGTALLAVGALLVVARPWYAEQQAQTAAQAPGDSPDSSPGGNGPAPRRTLWTDQGEAVFVRDFGGHEAQAAEVTGDDQLAQSASLALHLIRTAPADRGSNCHGWVFTGGRYVVDGADVERILHDNGYVAVTAPQPGDLVLYRSNGVRIAHSAVVRVADDGLVLLESKWASVGCFLHTPEVYCPGTPCTYYRSPRNGHLLRGLDPVPSPGGDAARADGQ